MRTITLELLRHGVAHNQLLSPLTPYLALCENHAAVTLNLPFEHNQFLHRLRALGYKLGDEPRAFQLQDTARVLGEILATIPGLTAESNKGNSTKGNTTSETEITHLRLIISASELALLPFELALSPGGMPGAGQNLLLQPQSPICLTREVRRVPGEIFVWPAKPRILFVAAQPPDVGAIPVEAHLLALRRMISPWMNYFEADDPEQRRRQERIQEHLTFLPAASIKAIEDACATGEYTHVHILAHGVEIEQNHEKRFAVALHHDGDPNQTDYVDGPRLASALRAAQRNSVRELARPAVVTLASCDSGNQGSVAGAGASIAHALHFAGIPMVVASQFPLSFQGSVLMVDVLYEGLLCGEDPRLLLHDLRRRLHSQFPRFHDWSSLTVYASLPSDLDGQLDKVKIAQARRCIDAAFSHAAPAILRAYDKAQEAKVDEAKLSYQAYDAHKETQYQQILESAREKVEEAKKRLKALLKRIPAETTEILGLLASTEKRHAEVLYFTAWVKGGKPDAKKQKETLDLLHKAKDYYWQASQKQGDQGWVLVQYLSLAVILKSKRPIEGMTDQSSAAEFPELMEDSLEDLWTFARIFSRKQLRSSDSSGAVWALGNLIELHLLAQVLKSEKLPQDPIGFQDTALRYTDELLARVERTSFEIQSTRQQIKRYITWYSEIADIPKLVESAKQIYQRFPSEEE